MDGEMNVDKIETKEVSQKDVEASTTTKAYLEGHIETPNGEICPVKMTVEAPADGFRGLFTPESEFKIQLYDRNTKLTDFEPNKKKEKE